MMKHLVRIIGRNGVVYEERMTGGQITQFLQLTEARTSLGVAFDEWEVILMEEGEQPPDESERDDTPLTPLQAKLHVLVASPEAYCQEGHHA